MRMNKEGRGKKTPMSLFTANKTKQITTKEKTSRFIDISPPNPTVSSIIQAGKQLHKNSEKYKKS